VEIEETTGGRFPACGTLACFPNAIVLATSGAYVIATEPRLQASGAPIG
jgi:hypothetical protein